MARAKAMALGRAHETSYLNPDGEPVKIELTAIETLDELGSIKPAGREVYSERWEAEKVRDRVGRIHRRSPSRRTRVSELLSTRTPPEVSVPSSLPPKRHSRHPGFVAARFRVGGNRAFEAAEEFLA